MQTARATLCTNHLYAKLSYTLITENETYDDEYYAYHDFYYSV